MIHGSKALDAEIIIDFKSNTVKMDYSTTPKGLNALQNSNKLTLWEEKQQPKHVFLYIKSFIVFSICLFFEQIITIIIGIINLFRIEGYIYSKFKIDLLHQKLLKICMENSHGVSEQSVISSIKYNYISFHISSNLWFHYDLSEDYEKNIQKISLLRFYERRTVFGRNMTKQWGWIVRFDFDKPPENGHCIVRYL